MNAFVNAPTAEDIEQFGLELATELASMRPSLELPSALTPPPPPPPPAKVDLPPMPDEEPPVGTPEWEEYQNLLIAHAAVAAENASNEELPPFYGEDAMAWRFSELHRDDLRFVNKFGLWYHWEGHRWKEDGTLLAYDLARRMLRGAAEACRNPSVAASITKASTVAAIERMAKADRRHAAVHDLFDSNIWLLNTPDCTVDLKTGECRPHDPNDFCSKIAGASPGGECPQWHDFLAFVTGGDADYKRFLQKMMGYALTGDTSAHALFFLYGLGKNGKSVFVDTLSGILGEYHKAAPVETFTASNSDRHPTELAMLRGARLVTAVETEEGRRWAEARIKQLTGGDPISARFMRQDFFEFVPQFKLVIAGNHKPGLRSVDEAIKRRFNLCPFTNTVRDEDRDFHLKEKLKAEWPGILAWMIEGCLAWQQEGLKQPAAVAEATKDYMDAEDIVGLWLEECCVKASEATSMEHLWQSWQKWATSGDEYTMTKTKLRGKLEDRGFSYIRREYGMAFLGLSLRAQG